MEEESIWIKSAKPTEFLFAVFMRFVAVSCFYFGIRYWAMLIGYADDGAARFDLMSSQWRTAAAVLSVLYPVAALGLWSGVSWGVVLWVAAAGYEALIHSFWYLIYGKNDLLVTMHLMVASVFAAFVILMWYQRRAARRAVTVDSL